MDPFFRSRADLFAHLAAHGAGPDHARRALREWVKGGTCEQAPPPSPRRGPAALVRALPAVHAALDGLAVEVERIEAGDGNRRRLFRLDSGATVEAVDLSRHGVCISTQVGCAVGCRFCRTGEEGLLQQLTSLEILAQVVRIRRERRVERVLFMGMGEPAHNLDAVLEAIDVLGGEGDIPRRHLVFSTVGEPRVFARLAAGPIRPGLALSLHTLDADLRADLLPRAPRIDPVALLEAGLDYAESTGYPLLVQWTLLEGVNDDPAEGRRLGALLRGRRGLVNYIPFNAVEGNGYRRPPVERCVELVRTVKAQGGMATLRISAAQDVDGGCGQLRARRTTPPA
jgi:23S rRNA (adenine2503-C2)-methyltransferase